MKAAFGRINLTPDDYRGKALSGYGNWCYGKLDDIHGSVILFENKGKSMLLLTLDFIKVPIPFTDYIKLKIREKFNIPSESILIHATHTHKSFDQGGEFLYPGSAIGFLKGIMFGATRKNWYDKYNIWVTNKLLKLIEKLKTELEDCEIAWTKKRIEENLIVNRRHPERKSKSDLGIISLQGKKSKRNIGVIVTYSMHPTTLGAEINKLSADYPGVLVNHMHKLSNYKLNVAFFTSPAGDINPITTCGTDFEELAELPKNTLFSENKIYAQQGTYENTTEIGRKLAEISYQIYQSIKQEDYLNKFDFNTKIRRFIIPLRDYTNYHSKVWLGNRLLFLFKRYFMIGIPAFISESKKPNFPGFAIKKSNGQYFIETVVQYIQIGTKKRKLSISGIPGELFEEYAEGFYEKSPNGRENTFIFQNSNDWPGYLQPFNQYITEGGYEVFMSFTPLAGEYVKRNYYKLLEEVIQ
jgi:hypothetical protein